MQFTIKKGTSVRIKVEDVAGTKFIEKREDCSPLELAADILFMHLANVADWDVFVDDMKGVFEGLADKVEEIKNGRRKSDAPADTRKMGEFDMPDGAHAAIFKVKKNSPLAAQLEKMHSLDEQINALKDKNSPEGLRMKAELNSYVENMIKEL